MRSRFDLNAQTANGSSNGVGDGWQRPRARAALRFLRQTRGPKGRYRQTLFRVLRHTALQQFHAAHPVNQRMVHFDEKGKTVLVEPFDNRAFPWRTCQVNGRAVQTRHQFAQLTLATRPRQRGMAHVVLQIDGVVLDPHRHRIFIEGVFQTPVPRRGEVPIAAELGHHFLQKVLWCILWQPELQQPTHMVGGSA